MTSPISGNRPGMLGGLMACTLFLATLLFLPAQWLGLARDRGHDAVLAVDAMLRPLPATVPPVVVVDIDQTTIAKLGNWPWPRETMAQLVEAVTAARPSAVGIDILFAARDPAGLSAPDDASLARAIKAVPTVLGFTFDTEPGAPMTPTRITVRGAPVLPDLWREAGAAEPASALARAASGLGLIALPGDFDGKVRRVPLLASVGDRLRPGFAVETVRLAQKAATVVIDATPQVIGIGALKLPLPEDGFLRLVHSAHETDGRRTVSATEVLDGGAARGRLSGAIVLIGGSAPQLGGLRETAHDTLTPSVQIEADAISQILRQRAPLAVPDPVQIVLALLLALTTLAAGVLAAPLRGVMIAIAAIALAWTAAIALSLARDLLADPLLPTVGAAATFLAGSIGSHVTVSRREAFIRNRFAQHLSPDVVRRIAENPAMMKLRAETREVTALFTDIEGFTTMTHRAGPEQLVAELDGYIEGVAAIVMDHGGMVDKIVGDAVHALFNAPFDLDDHAAKAIRCAIAIRAWTEQYRQRDGARAIGFGRTRIGIETGKAVVGDIGIRSKLDYTAHGDAINSAARLEALNKELGSAICIGPVAAARFPAEALRPLGTVSLRGIGMPIDVFEPWPNDAPAAWRASYLAACQLAASDPVAAADEFLRLAGELGGDPVATLQVARFRSPSITR